MHQPSRFSVLGLLVDRAVSMPYAKPQRLDAGWRVSYNNWQATIQQDVDEAAAFLKRALTAKNAEYQWSKAELAVDPAGPWWSRTRDDYFALTNKDRDWIMERLAPTSRSAAASMLRYAETERWDWLWSQPSFVKPGGVRPAITRPDLIAGFGPSRCIIVDVKTTSHDVGNVKYSRNSFQTWTHNLDALGFDVTGTWVLAVSSEGDDTRWLRADNGD